MFIDWADGEAVAPSDKGKLGVGNWMCSGINKPGQTAWISRMKSYDGGYKTGVLPFCLLAGLSIWLSMFSYSGKFCSVL